MSQCWFCDRPARAGFQFRAGLHRDVRVIFFGIGAHQRWKQTWVDIPRCPRCQLGHRIEQVLFYVVLVSAAPTALMLLAWAASAPWNDQWQVALPPLWVLLCVLLWSAVRRHWLTMSWLAPRPQRFARQYPAVQDLFEEGWSYRGRP